MAGLTTLNNLRSQMRPRTLTLMGPHIRVWDSRGSILSSMLTFRPLVVFSGAWTPVRRGAPNSVDEFQPPSNQDTPTIRRS